VYCPTTDYEERIRGYKVLANEIYQRGYSSGIGTKQVFSFILGDYNMCLMESNSLDQRATMPLDVQRFEYGRHVIKTIQEQKTTIRGKSRRDPDLAVIEERGLSELFNDTDLWLTTEGIVIIKSDKYGAKYTSYGRIQYAEDGIICGSVKLQQG